MLLYSKLDMGKNSQARGLLLLAVMMDSCGAGAFVLIACIESSRVRGLQWYILPSLDVVPSTKICHRSSLVHHDIPCNIIPWTTYHICYLKLQL